MGTYVRAKTPDKGIESWLGTAGIGYVSLIELGNVFLDCDDWEDRYARLMEQSGALLTERLADVPAPFCLLCAEKNVQQCHRRLIAEELERQGHEGVHL